MEPKLIEHPSYFTSKESRKATTPTFPAFPRATPNLTCVWKRQTIKAAPDTLTWAAHDEQCREKALASLVRQNPA